MIPLRPIGFGEILDGAFSSIRQNPRATLGLAAILMTIAGVISATISIIAIHQVGTINLPTAGQNLTRAQVGHLFSQIATGLVIPALASALLAVVVQSILAGLLTAVIGRAVLGQRISMRQAWQIAAPRLPALIGAAFALLGILIGLWIVLGLIVLALYLAGAPAGALIAVGVLGFFPAFAAMVWLGIRFSLATPAVVLERQGPLQALRRSGQLVKGSFWRVFGVLLLAGLIVAVAGSILQIPFSLVAGASGGFSLSSHAISMRGVDGHADRRGRCHHRGHGDPAHSGGGDRPAVHGHADAQGGPRPGPADRGGKRAGAGRRIRVGVAAAHRRPGIPARRPDDAPAAPSTRRGGAPAVVMAASLTSSAAAGGGDPSTATSMTARALGAAAFPAMPATAAAAHPIGRGAAQRLARTELSKAIYHPHESLIQRILGAIYDWLSGLFATTSAAPGGWWGLVALAALAVLVIAVVVDPDAPGRPGAQARGRPDPRGQGRYRPRAPVPRRPAGQRGSYFAATLEIVRTIARQLEEQGVFAPRIGRTSGEFANEAGQVLPSEAGALRDAARRFDDVCYGQGQGRQDGYRRLRALDARIAAARTGAGQQPAPVPVTAGGSPR